MKWLMAREIEIALEGSAFVGDAYDLSEEGATLEVEPQQIEELTSEAPIPSDRYQLGDMIKLNALLVDALEGDSFSGSSLSLSRIRDITLKVATVDGDRLFFIKGANMIKKYNLAFKQEDVFYLPVTIEGRLDTVLKIGYLEDREEEDGSVRTDEAGATRTVIILE